MKNIFILCFLCISSALFAFDGIFLGLGAEAGANTPEGISIGGRVTFGIDANQSLALGMETAFSNNLKTISNLEHDVLLRFYPPLKLRGLFVQAELGVSIFFKEESSYPALLGGLGAGWHFPIRKSLYIEPYIKGGYPFIWGAGLSFGYTSKVHELIEEVPFVTR